MHTYDFWNMARLTSIEVIAMIQFITGSNSDKICIVKVSLSWANLSDCATSVSIRLIMLMRPASFITVRYLGDFDNKSAK